eukprot:UN05907
MHKPNRNKLALHLFHFLSPSPRQRRTNGTRRRRSSRSGKDSSLLGELSPDLPPAVDFHHGSSPRGENQPPGAARGRLDEAPTRHHVKRHRGKPRLSPKPNLTPT